MKIINVVQGSPEWLSIRRDKFTASEASAMMGVSKHMSRDALLHQKKTSEVPEVSPAQQHIYDQGHAAEEQARPLAETIIGEELYPATGVNGDYLASFDGITMTHDVAFEHKLINEGFRQLLSDGLEFDASDLEPHYYWQLEHQCLVSNCEKILFMASDGTDKDCKICWYYSTPERRDQLIAGWDQFAKDLECYEPVIETPKPEAAAIESLPAIIYRLNGLALTSNLEAYRTAAEKLVEESKKPLEDDQDFVDREALVKKFKEAEGKIKLVQEQVVGEIHDVDSFCKELGYISDLIRQARLAGEKAVKCRKDEIKREIVSKAEAELTAVFDEFNRSLHKLHPTQKNGVRLPPIDFDLQAAIKGKKTLKSLQEAANDQVAQVKIAANLEFNQIKSNLIEFKSIANNYELVISEQYSLFTDLQEIITSPHEAFVAIVKSRIADQKQAQKERFEQERKRIREEEELKAKRDVQTPEVATAINDAEPMVLVTVQVTQSAHSDFIKLLINHLHAEIVSDTLVFIKQQSLHKPVNISSNGAKASTTSPNGIPILRL